MVPVVRSEFLQKLLQCELQKMEVTRVLGWASQHGVQWHDIKDHGAGDDEIAGDLFDKSSTMKVY